MSKSAPLPPGSTIGILGGGQLGRMLSQAATSLGFRTHILCPDEKCPAGEVATDWTHADYTDAAAIEQFVAAVDVVTYEFENVPVACADMVLEAGGLLRPGKRALEVAQDRLTEKRFCKDLGIETAPFMPVANAEAASFALNVTGIPAIMKTRRLGYDGKGQQVIHEESEATTAWQSLQGAPGIMEGFVPFEREISIILARSTLGHVTYDPPENVHKDGILRVSSVPGSITAEVQDRAKEIATQIAQELDYIGVLAVEFFVEKSGLLRVNEMAPRVHNSGHWTADACYMGQFEAHIRAICGWPFGSTARHSDARMENLIGEDAADWSAHAAQDKAKLTLYGKKEMRPGRKMGHVTYLSARR
ncbi:5-(carboxyamino)imidazole ribonucleotide synthase [Parvularcula sp. IMCC14364]|uniref:5-(carboxyamino)imidazole ribonucleotide synthase n=1 Tax=Parvularcula sp. IMCC14364 TaxID=3067902 RepID=UPI0027425C40|nr:5-(carboxyamino)imidazole ribonucleotide synthase [Parvularcula sp. IMCC14364]